MKARAIILLVIFKNFLKENFKISLVKKYLIALALIRLSIQIDWSRVVIGSLSFDNFVIHISKMDHSQKKKAFFKFLLRLKDNFNETFRI